MHRAVFADAGLGPREGAAEAVVVERLEQVVERLGLEGSEREAVVRRDEDDGADPPGR